MEPHRRPKKKAEKKLESMAETKLDKKTEKETETKAETKAEKKGRKKAEKKAKKKFRSMVELYKCIENRQEAYKKASINIAKKAARLENWVEEYFADSYIDTNNKRHPAFARAIQASISTHSDPFGAASAQSILDLVDSSIKACTLDDESQMEYFCRHEHKIRAAADMTLDVVLLTCYLALSASYQAHQIAHNQKPEDAVKEWSIYDVTVLNVMCAKGWISTWQVADEAIGHILQRFGPPSGPQDLKMVERIVRNIQSKYREITQGTIEHAEDKFTKSVKSKVERGEQIDLKAEVAIFEAA